MGDVEDAGGLVRFGFSVGCCASGAGFTLSKIEDSCAPAAGMHREEGAAAGLFDVVAVGGDGEDVDQKQLLALAISFQAKGVCSESG
jgi:hypothetical protein